MTTIKTNLRFSCIFLIFTVTFVFPQNNEKFKVNRTNLNNLSRKTDAHKASSGDVAPNSKVELDFRWVIVSDEVNYEDDSPQAKPRLRSLVLLIEKRAFNEKNLIKLFNYISKEIPQPTHLVIEVHTSLMTLETPEERSMLSTHSSRERFYELYKTAGYSRFTDGSSIFDYDTGLPRKFVRKSVKLQDKN